MRDLMIDLETLGVYPGCALLSLGATFFDLHSKNNSHGPTFYANIDKMSCYNHGMHVESATEEWWAQQGEEARIALQNPFPIHIDIALQSFREWILTNSELHGVRVWSNGASFDLALLRDAERRTKVKMPWSYRMEMDTRTLMMVAAHKKPATYDVLIHGLKYGRSHHALDDAIKQSRQMQLCWGLINE